MRRPRLLIALAVLAVLAMTGAACSGGDSGSSSSPADSNVAVSDADGNEGTNASTDTDTDEPGPTAGLPVTTLAADAPGATAPTVSAAEPATTATTATPRSAGTDSAAAIPATDPPPAETVPEAGVPGLDSDDLFCAAWSRFGGTWQVLLVGSTFLDDADLVARWEVSSAPLVVGAYTELLAQLPDELETERDALADGYFGVFERRARDARDSLVGSGANGGDIAGLSEAWLAALETRDPSTPEVAFVEPDALVGLVDVAAADLVARRTEFHLDPSMIVTAETPLTDAYLEANCPDQGTLAGGEIEG